MAPRKRPQGARSEAQPSEVGRTGPPPLRPFGLVLHHDGRWTHEGVPIRNARLRAAFDRGVRFLPDEGPSGKYVVQLGRFRGEIEPEEAAFFVRGFDPETGALSLSDGSQERLDVASLSVSPRDGALLCRVKRALAPGGLPARFQHAAHAELLNAVVEEAGGAGLRLGGELVRLPAL
jgi:hypothetical protein